MMRKLVSKRKIQAASVYQTEASGQVDVNTRRAAIYSIRRFARPADSTHACGLALLKMSFLCLE
jgi:hypothetical protein